jgi:hypothetical protein
MSSTSVCSARIAGRDVSGIAKVKGAARRSRTNTDVAQGNFEELRGNSEENARDAC